ncbi:unnamed protein product, partial [Ixodes hexagonus]
ARDFSRNCLKARIQEKKQQIQQVRRRLYAAETCLRTKLRPNDFHDIIRARKQAEDLERSKCSEVHRQKLSRLLPHHRPQQDNLEAVHNFSSKHLSDDHVSLLSKGLNFAIAPRKVPKRDIIVEVEEKLRHIQDTTGVNLARSRIVSVLANAKSTRTNLTRGKRAALSDLKSDKSIVILSADKGKGTVLLDRKEYDEKMCEILNDPLHFVKLNHDPTAKSERQLVDHLQADLRLDQTLYRRLFSSDGATPKIYGLPKVHKEGCPLRPIVSFVGSPTYNLSNFLVEMLKPLTDGNSRSVRNSHDFVTDVRTQQLLDDDVMVSFDVILCLQMSLSAWPLMLWRHV